jgi:hypothetical protein
MAAEAAVHRGYWRKFCSKAAMAKSVARLPKMIEVRTSGDSAIVVRGDEGSGQGRWVSLGEICSDKADDSDVVLRCNERWA